MDFIIDVLGNRRMYALLIGVDALTCKCVALEELFKKGDF